jgi:hypothetical protein
MRIASIKESFLFFSGEKPNSFNVSPKKFDSGGRIPQAKLPLHAEVEKAFQAGQCHVHGSLCQELAIGLPFADALLKHILEQRAGSLFVPLH